MFVIITVLFAAVLLYLWLIFPAVKRRDISSLLRKPIAHRGAHGDGIPENSLRAFEEAVQCGYPIELDIRLSADGIPMVIHDDSLFRLCGDIRHVSELTAGELSDLFIGETEEKIPTLSQVLETVNGRVPLLIELKSGGNTAERAFEILKNYTGYYAVESFDPYCLYRYRRKDKKTPIGILARRSSGVGRAKERIFWILSGRVIFNFLCRPDFICYRISDSLPFSVKLASLLGASLIGWTAKDRAEYISAKSRFDGVICDNIYKIEKNNGSEFTDSL